MQNPKLSDTARAVLIAACDHPCKLASPPTRLPAAAQRAVMKSLLKAGLLIEIETGDDKLALRISDTGLDAVTATLGDASDKDRPTPDAQGAPHRETTLPPTL